MKTIDTKSWWYKNCVRQRKRKAKICDSCPFREDIEFFEKEKCTIRGMILDLGKPNDIENSAGKKYI